MIEWPSKDPDEAILYGIDFADRLADGVTLTGTPTFTQASLTITGQAVVDGTIAQAKVAGGVLGRDYEVLVHVTTSDSQTLEETAILRIRAR